MATKPSVKFKRVLRKGVEDGSDIIAVKRAVARHGEWPWMQFDAIWRTGPGTFADVGLKNFQKHTGLKVDGIYGPDTHLKLVGSKIPSGRPHSGEWCFDQTSINLYNGYQDFSQAEKTVKAIYTAWRCMEKISAQWHYSQRRPISYTQKCAEGGFGDCSGTVLMTSKWAGAKSPDILYGYSGYGNTDSLRRGGFAISLAEVGRYCKDHLVLAFYGYSWGTTDHVIAGETPALWHSHGSESGPNTYESVFYGHHSPFLGCRAYAVV